MSELNNDIHPGGRDHARRRREAADVVSGPQQLPPELKERRSELVMFAVRVHLAGAKPQIWRRLRLPSDLTLDRLHLVLRGAMGWEGHAAHHFQMEPFNDQPVAVFRAINSPRDPSVPDESVVRLDEVLAEPGDRLHYLYHPGDDWHHVIRLEHVYPVYPQRRGSDPKCTEGRGTCPLEGVGGVRVWNQVRAVQAGRAPVGSVDADLLRRILLAREHRPFNTIDADLRVAFSLTTSPPLVRSAGPALHSAGGSRWTPRPRADMVEFHCVLDGRAAGQVGFVDIGPMQVLLIDAPWGANARAGYPGQAVQDGLTARDAGYLHFLDPAFAPFWCPDCEATYCGDHWRSWVGDGGGAPARTWGQCPRGHERLLR